MTRLVITGDDFGLSYNVNAAIEEAHVTGVLSAASLMVAEEAASDAIERARRLPKLRVGLHLVVVKGRALSAAKDIPRLARPDGRLSNDQVASSIKLAISPGMQRDLAFEINAQFEAFARCGLKLDHVNSHCHMHLHPLILNLILKIGPAYGMRSMRIVREPPSARPKHLSGLMQNALIAPWSAYMRMRLRHAGISHNDYLVGLSQTGRMSADVLLGLLEHLPDSFCEIYGHPGASTAESAAFRDPRVLERVAALQLQPGGFT